jgi:hypothetical protein
MRQLILATMMTMPVLGWGAAGAKSNQCTGGTQFPGTYLKWVKIAEPIFQKQHLNLENYNIAIFDDPESVTVLLMSTDDTCEGRGSTGTRPDFEVKISKKDMRIVHYNYER